MKPPLTTEARKGCPLTDALHNALPMSGPLDVSAAYNVMLHHASDLERANQVLTEALEEAKNYFQVNGYAPETPILVKIVEALK